VDTVEAKEEVEDTKGDRPVIPHQLTPNPPQASSTWAVKSTGWVVVKGEGMVTVAVAVAAAAAAAAVPTSPLASMSRVAMVAPGSVREPLSRAV
jgi:hypothetical protein